MTKYHQEKAEKLLERHLELEQSEMKAQGTLVIILSLTQITELKLLLDIGRSGHDFYDFVLTLLLASISLEIFIAIVILYIGNLNYLHSANSDDVTSARSLSDTSTPISAYSTKKCLSASEDCDLVTGSPKSHEIADSLICDRTSVVERLVASIETALIKMADIELKTAQLGRYVRVIEDALRHCPGNADLHEELSRARSKLSAVRRAREETEVKRRAAESQLDRALVVKRREETREALEAFQRICYWQQMATYGLYVVMLMNIFITTFGISGGGRVLVTKPHHVNESHVIVPLPLHSQSASSALNTTNYH